MRRVLEKCHSETEINLPKETELVLKNEPVVLICNHPAQAEVLILPAVIPPRKKIFMVAMHGLLSILPAADKHLIPVWVTYADQSKNSWKYRIFRKFHSVKEYSEEEAHQKNIKSVELAINRINRGAMIVIFPTGGAKNGSDFKPGIGHLIKNLKYPEKTKIVMAHIRGTSGWDFFRILPLVGKILPKFKIDFAKPFRAEDFWGENARAISYNLQNSYYRWALAFEPLPKVKSWALYLRSILLFIFFRR